VLAELARGSFLSCGFLSWSRSCFLIPESVENGSQDRIGIGAPGGAKTDILSGEKWTSANLLWTGANDAENDKNFI